MHVPSRFTPLSMPRPALPPEERAARLKAAEQRYANSEKRASWRGSERYRNKLPVDRLGETSLHHRSVDEFDVNFRLDPARCTGRCFSIACATANLTCPPRPSPSSVHPAEHQPDAIHATLLDPVPAQFPASLPSDLATPAPLPAEHLMDAGPSRRQSSTQPASADPGPSSRASRSSSLSVELDHQADLKVKSTQAYKEETAAAEKLWKNVTLACQR